MRGQLVHRIVLPGGKILAQKAVLLIAPLAQIGLRIARVAARVLSAQVVQLIVESLDQLVVRHRHPAGLLKLRVEKAENEGRIRAHQEPEAVGVFERGL